MTGVKILNVCPGSVRTQISSNALMGDGSKFGVSDPNISAGLHAEYWSMHACVLPRALFVLARWHVTASREPGGGEYNTTSPACGLFCPAAASGCLQPRTQSLKKAGLLVRKVVLSPCFSSPHPTRSVWDCFRCGKASQLFPKSSFICDAQQEKRSTKASISLSFSRGSRRTGLLSVFPRC